MTVPDLAVLISQLPQGDSCGTIDSMKPARAVVYLRVSTDEQGRSGLGLADQRTVCESEIGKRGWTTVRIIEDVASAKDMNRAGLSEALDLIATGKADAIIVSKLDRLTRSLADFARLSEWATRCEARLIVIDLGIDTGTTTGRLVASIMASVAQWEREQIAERTRDAASVRRAQGKRMGRVSVRDSNPELAQRINDDRLSGKTWQAIADQLNEERLPTVRGGALWRVSAVQSAAGYVRPAGKPKGVVLPEARRGRRAALAG